MDREGIRRLAQRTWDCGRHRSAFADTEQDYHAAVTAIACRAW